MNSFAISSRYRRRFIYRLIILIVMTFGFLQSGYSQDSTKMFSPLAVVVVVVPEGEAGVFLDILSKFTAERSIEIRNFPKVGQRAVNMNIPIGPETFFYVHNSVSRNQFNLIAYSREQPSSWTSTWGALVDRLSATFGKERVVERQAPPASQ